MTKDRGTSIVRLTGGCLLVMSSPSRKRKGVKIFCVFPYTCREPTNKSLTIKVLPNPPHLSDNSSPQIVILELRVSTIKSEATHFCP